MLISDETLRCWAKGGFCDGNAVTTIAALSAELLEMRAQVQRASAIMSAVTAPERFRESK